MIRINLFILFSFFTSSLIAQHIDLHKNADTAKIFSIKRYRTKIDSLTIKIQEIKLILDSNEVEVSVKDYGNKIKTINHFLGSKTFLKINLYFKDNEVIYVEVKEESPIASDIYRLTSFYFENKKIFFTTSFSTVRTCLAIPKNKSIYDAYGYNPDLIGDSLEKYIIRILGRIKTAANKSTY